MATIKIIGQRHPQTVFSRRPSLRPDPDESIGHRSCSIDYPGVQTIDSPPGGNPTASRSRSLSTQR